VKVIMQRAEALSIEQIRQFLAASSDIGLTAECRREIYAWVETTLRQQQYMQQPKAVRGLILQYIGKMTGLSTAQVDRLVRRFRQTGEVKPSQYRRNRFPARFTRRDVELLAAVDQAHDTLSGPATRRILEREFHEFGHAEYERLATISNGHLYNLRKHRRYRECRLHYTRTKPTQVAIGERRKPDPGGRPGYLRVDTVHQGDSADGVKGVYHINAVDEVTQWQVVGCTPAISEAWLEPLLEAMLRQFPFQIHNFHSDNGSEFINHTVAKLLEKLLVDQTKSRPRRSSDNGLAETKNGAVIRKHMGYSHIAARGAERIQSFYECYFNPYLNFHRPCAQPDVEVRSDGKRIRRYKRYRTPLETLMALPPALRDLRPGLSAEALQSQAQRQSDTEAARHMQEAKHRLFLELRRSA
jgi:transposase InsO family protein